MSRNIDESEEILARLFVDEFDNIVRKIVIEALATSTLLFPKNGSVRVTAVSAAAARAFSHIMLAQCAALVDHRARKEQQGEAVLRKRPTRETQLFATLVMFNMTESRQLGKDVFNLAHKQLAALGHELSDPIIEVVED